MDDLARAAAGKVLMGTCGWSDPTLLKCGKLYPSGVKTAEQRLQVYSNTFPCVEVDSSCYAIPRPSTTTKWVKATPRGFKFHFKAFSMMCAQAVTLESLPTELRSDVAQSVSASASTGGGTRVSMHQLPHDLQDAIWRNFHEALMPVVQADRMGCVLFQFQLSFMPIPANLFYIEILRQRLDPRLSMAVEFRNRGWFGDEVKREWTVNFLAKYGICLVASDDLQHEMFQRDREQTGLPAGAKRIVLPIALEVTTPTFGYARIHRRHGSNERLLQDHEIQEWAERLHQLCPQLQGPYYFMWGTDWEDVPLINARNLDSAIGAELAFDWKAFARKQGKGGSIRSFFTAPTQPEAVRQEVEAAAVATGETPGTAGRQKAQGSAVNARQDAKIRAEQSASDGVPVADVAVTSGGDRGAECFNGSLNGSGGTSLQLRGSPDAVHAGDESLAGSRSGADDTHSGGYTDGTIADTSCRTSTDSQDFSKRHASPAAASASQEGDGEIEDGPDPDVDESSTRRNVEQGHSVSRTGGLVKQDEEQGGDAVEIDVSIGRNGAPSWSPEGGPSSSHAPGSTSEEAQAVEEAIVQLHERQQQAAKLQMAAAMLKGSRRRKKKDRGGEPMTLRAFASHGAVQRQMMRGSNVPSSGPEDCPCCPPLPSQTGGDIRAPEESMPQKPPACLDPDCKCEHPPWDAEFEGEFLEFLSGMQSQGVGLSQLLEVAGGQQVYAVPDLQDDAACTEAYDSLQAAFEMFCAGSAPEDAAVPSSGERGQKGDVASGGLSGGPVLNSSWPPPDSERASDADGFRWPVFTATHGGDKASFGFAVGSPAAMPHASDGPFEKVDEAKTGDDTASTSQAAPGLQGLPLSWAMASGGAGSASRDVAGAGVPGGKVKSGPCQEDGGSVGADGVGVAGFGETGTDPPWGDNPPHQMNFASTGSREGGSGSVGASTLQTTNSIATDGVFVVGTGGGDSRKLKGSGVRSTGKAKKSRKAEGMKLIATYFQPNT